MDSPTVVLSVPAGRQAGVADTVASVLASTFKPRALVLAVDRRVLSDVQSNLPSGRDQALAVDVLPVDPDTSPGALYNAGVAATRTSLLLPLSAGDRLDPTFVEKAVWALHAHPEWAFVNARLQAIGSRSLGWDQGFERGRDFLSENLAPSSIAVIRRSADALIGGQSVDLEPGLVEWDYWLRMAAHGLWGGTLPEVLIVPRLNHEADRDTTQRRQAFRHQISARYPQLKHGAWPKGKVVAEEAEPVARTRPAKPTEPPHNNLLLLVPWFSLGGVDRYNLTLIQGLTRRGWAVTVCATTRGPHDWLNEYTAATPDCFILPHFLPAGSQPEFLRHLIQSRRVSHVLVTHSMLGYRLVPYLRAHHPQVAFVDYNHMVASDWPSGGYPGQGVRAQPLLDLNLVSSAMVRDWMIAQGADPARIAVSYTGVDTTRFDPGRFDRQAVRRQHGAHDHRPVLIFAGRLVAQKRPELFIAIVRALMARGLVLEAWIAGDGPLMPQLKNAIHRAGLQGVVRLLGALPAGDIPALLAAGDVFVLPSLNEGIALVLFEAMALGLPVVSADVGGQRELVSAEAGFLVAPGADELDGYVAALSGLLGDPERRARMGAAARQRVSAHFALAETLAQMEGLLQQAADLSAAAPRPRPSVQEAERLMADVVADVELDRLQEQLRVPDAGRRAPGWRAQLAFFAKQRILRPAYYWGLRQGIPGLDRAATWAFRRLRWLLG